jgi:hypothetical protein
MSYRSIVRSTRVLPLVLGLLGACATQDNGPGYGYGGDDGGGGGGGGYDGYGCGSDADCNYSGGSDYVCARDETCQLQTNVRVVRVTWTIEGSGAGSASCASSPDLELLFNQTEQVSDENYQFGFAPVPCVEGEFSIDKMPDYYEYVGMFDSATFGGGGDDGVTGMFDGSGNCTLDLSF